MFSKLNKALLLAFVVVSVSVWVGSRGKHAEAPVTKQESTVATSGTDADESKENAVTFNWQGTNDEPKKLVIQKTGVSAFIQKLGVAKDNSIATPTNVHLAGWYNASAKPGQTGLTVLVGHVAGKTTNGVFADLDKLLAGDMFSVELGDGTLLAYEVIQTQTVPEADALSFLFSQQPNVASQLNLITCTGAYNAATSSYPDRIILQAKMKG